MGGRLVVGLGNPGPEYEHTWHNLGFRVVREVASGLKCSLKERGGALVGRTRTAGQEVALLLPMQYMNLSGRPVRKWANKLNLFDEEILVVLDDHDLPRGLIRMKPSGGDGGHRGLRSVLAEMNSTNIPRLRIGIRDETVDPRAGGYDDLADRVLQPLSERDLAHIAAITRQAGLAVRDWLNQGITTAMNRYNNLRVEPPRGVEDIPG